MQQQEQAPYANTNNSNSGNGVRSSGRRQSNYMPNNTSVYSNSGTDNATTAAAATGNAGNGSNGSSNSSASPYRSQRTGSYTTRPRTSDMNSMQRQPKLEEDEVSTSSKFTLAMFSETYIAYTSASCSL
jgi:hypothetical protein